jgi:hypothetical protein
MSPPLLALPPPPLPPSLTLVTPPLLLPLPLVLVGPQESAPAEQPVLVGSCGCGGGVHVGREQRAHG